MVRMPRKVKNKKLKIGKTQKSLFKDSPSNLPTTFEPLLFTWKGMKSIIETFPIQIYSLSLKCLQSWLAGSLAVCVENLAKQIR